MITIIRWHQPDCTLGRLQLSDGWQCFTLELPWRDNKRGVSCIPAGTYKAFKRNSPKNGPVFELRDVPSRTNIQCHAGNFTRQIEGCILVGDAIRFLDGDGIPDIANSGATLKALLAKLPDEFEVKIL